MATVMFKVVASNNACGVRYILGIDCVGEGLFGLSVSHFNVGNLSNFNKLDKFYADHVKV